MQLGIIRGWVYASLLEFSSRRLEAVVSGLGQLVSLDQDLPTFHRLQTQLVVMRLLSLCLAFYWANPAPALPATARPKLSFLSQQGQSLPYVPIGASSSTLLDPSPLDTQISRYKTP